MYVICDFETKPACNGNSRALFQNKSNHKLAMMSRSVFSNHGAVELLNERLQINVITEASAITTIQRSQVFFAASNVSSPPAIELPGPGFFISAASATGRHEEPANETSQLLSLSKPS